MNENIIDKVDWVVSSGGCINLSDYLNSIKKDMLESYFEHIRKSGDKRDKPFLSTIKEYYVQLEVRENLARFGITEDKYVWMTLKKNLQVAIEQN